MALKKQRWGILGLLALATATAGAQDVEKTAQSLIDPIPSFSCIIFYPDRGTLLYDSDTGEVQLRGIIEADYKPLYISRLKVGEPSPGPNAPLLNIGADQIRSSTPTFTPVGSVAIWSTSLTAREIEKEQQPFQASVHVRTNLTTLMDSPEGAREKTMEEMDAFSKWLHDKSDKAPLPKEPKYTISKFTWLAECEYGKLSDAVKEAARRPNLR